MLKNLYIFALISCLLLSGKAQAAPELIDVGKGYKIVKGPLAKFDPEHDSVAIWTPSEKLKPPVMIYAHGGSGIRSSDERRDRYV